MNSLLYGAILHFRQGGAAGQTMVMPSAMAAMSSPTNVYTSVPGAGPGTTTTAAPQTDQAAPPAQTDQSTMQKLQDVLGQNQPSAPGAPRKFDLKKIGLIAGGLILVLAILYFIAK